MKPYLQIPIDECNEPLVPIPLDLFAAPPIHPYVELGAKYGDRSPYFLREGVLNALTEAQQILQKTHPGWRIFIFDAYRPVEVQKYMVNYTFNLAVKERKINLETLSEEALNTLWDEVYQMWALPSLDPTTPPPHSTGAALDVTLVNEQGEEVDMGSPIDELSARSYPDHFAQAKSPEEAFYHQNRQLLYQVMRAAQFRRHPKEWWHFSLGDQLWAWLSNGEKVEGSLKARYGGA